MSLLDCQGCEDLSSIPSSPSLSFHFMHQSPLRRPSVHHLHHRSYCRLCSPRYSRATSTSTYTTHQTTARAHEVSPPLSKFQAAARQSPTSVCFGGKRVFCFICKVLPVFISLKTDEQISCRMAKTEFAAEGEQETNLISAEK